MTIVVGSTRASELAASGDSNNPFALWNNRIDSITAPGGVSSGGAAINAISGFTYDVAKPLASGGGFVLEFTVTTSISAVGVAAHDIGTLGGSIRVQYSDDGGSSWSDSGAGIVNPSDNQAIVFRFDDQSHNDWRIFVGSGAGFPSIGVLMASQELIFPQRIYQGYTPPVVPNRVRLQSNVTEGGQLAGAAFAAEGSDVTASLCISRKLMERWN